MSPLAVPWLMSVGATPGGSWSPKKSLAVVSGNGERLHAVVVWFGCECPLPVCDVSLKRTVLVVASDHGECGGDADAMTFWPLDLARPRSGILLTGGLQVRILPEEPLSKPIAHLYAGGLRACWQFRGRAMRAPNGPCRPPTCGTC